MKTLNPLLIFHLTIFFNAGFAQEDGTTDLALSSNLIGSWEHVSSTYPSGDVITYHREIELFQDGKGTCTKYTDIDTVVIHFEWEVKENIIHLFVLSKYGKRMTGDSQQVSFVDSGKIYLTDAFGEDQTGKVCCYRRKAMEIAKY